MSGLSVGIIMDGNRRWAKAQGLNPWDGHREGGKKLQEVVEWSRDHGAIKHVAVYTFSTENWKRDPGEVAHLMSLIEEFFTNYAPEAKKTGVRIRIIGEREKFDAKTQTIFNEIEQLTEECCDLTLWFALSYGGRAELLHAARSCSPESEGDFQKHLWAAELPDLDIVLRTGGEKRLSNFFPWHSTYSELFFVDTFWPAFSKEEYVAVLDEFAQRQRRMGA